MKSVSNNYLNECVLLPDNPALKKRLKSKLDEYQKRIEKLKHDYVVDSVGVVVDRDDNLLDAIYKQSIVKVLLDEGEVNIGALREQLKLDFKGYLLDDLFSNAVNVINDYLTSSGVHTTGASKFFNEELFESALKESSRIEQSDDINIQKRLRKKYHEYLGRIFDHDQSNDKTIDTGAHKRDRYKAHIIKQLQNNGFVELHDVIHDLTESDGDDFARLEFYQASARIHELLDGDYSETDMGNSDISIPAAISYQ